MIDMTLGCNVFRHDCKEMFKINYEVNKFNKFIFKFKKYVDIEIIVNKKKNIEKKI